MKFFKPFLFGLKAECSLGPIGVCLNSPQNLYARQRISGALAPDKPFQGSSKPCKTLEGLNDAQSFI